MNLNSIHFSGRLTVDPAFSELPNEKKTIMVKFSLAQNFKVKGEEQSIFMNCVAYGKTAELFAEVKKRDQIIIEGRFNQNRWVDQTSGENRQNQETIVDRVHYFPRKVETT